MHPRCAIIICAVAISVTIDGQNQLDPTDVLSQARDHLLERTERLPNYTCVQTVDRKYLRPANPEFPAPSCDVISGLKKRDRYKVVTEGTDRMRLDVKVSEGREIASWVGANRFSTRDIIELIGGGPFGTGPLGTYIGDIFKDGGASFDFMGEVNGAFEYRFQVPAASSHNLIKITGGWTQTAYSGTFLIDPSSYDLKRLEVQTSELPPESEACDAFTTVDYQRVLIGAREFLAPARSSLLFTMRNGNETENVTTYTSCREYSAESTVRFDDVREDAAQAAPPAAIPVLIPAGLTVVLALAGPIDSDTAAVGDPVVLVVKSPVRNGKSKQVVIPAGAKVHARLIRMDHWLGSSGHFDFSFLLESIELNGATSPFYATRDRPQPLSAFNRGSGLRQPGLHIVLPPAGQPACTGSFAFFSTGNRYVLKRGFVSEWMTLLPPAK